MSATLQVLQSGPVARIVLNRPDVLNALNVEMATAFEDACRRLTRSADVRVIVLSGAGRAFMASRQRCTFVSAASGSNFTIRAKSSPV